MNLVYIHVVVFVYSNAAFPNMAIAFALCLPEIHHSHSLFEVSSGHLFTSSVSKWQLTNVESFAAS